MELTDITTKIAGVAAFIGAISAAYYVLLKIWRYYFPLDVVVSVHRDFENGEDGIGVVVTSKYRRIGQI